MNVRSILISRKRTVSLIRVGIFSFSRFFDELMPISFVRKAFDHCLRFMHGYRSGLVGPVLEYAVEKYKSHRRLSPTTRLDEIASEFAEKKAKKMTFKRCK